MKIFQDLQKLVQNRIVRIKNCYLENAFSSFTIKYFQEKEEINKIVQLNAQFEYIFFSKFVDKDNDTILSNYFIACFDYNVVIIPQNNINQLYKFFTKNKNISIICISRNVKNAIEQFLKSIDQNAHLNFVSTDHLFIQNDINSFTEKFSLTIQKEIPKNIDQIRYLWNSITQCISLFLLTKSYFNSKYDRIKNYKELFQTNNFGQIEMNNDIFINLRYLGSGSSSSVHLIYHIELNKLFALKVFQCTRKSSILFERECNNFINHHYPLVPRFFGTYNDGSSDCLIIEYIKGQSLSEIHQMNLTKEEKMKIIYEMMLIIEYIHFNGYIYRDIKPNNFIIDENKTVFLIDFDRMISIDSDTENEEMTLDFFDEFASSDFANGFLSTKADIYSLGLVIEFILRDDYYIQEYSKLNEMIMKCKLEDPSKRPNIGELIDLFYNEYYSKIMHINELENIQKIADIHNEFFFPCLFFIAEYQNQTAKNKLKLLMNALITYENENKSLIEYEKESQLSEFAGDIEFLNEASKLNFPIAQLHLGLRYFYSNNIKKAIHYLELASKNNVAQAHYVLGVIYDMDEFCMCDKNKAIHYFELAANSNDAESQFILGIIYFNGEIVDRDIKKAIHYCTLAANSNYVESQHFLGVLYLRGEYVDYDINKSIYYLSRASDLNHAESQCILGCIYYESQYASKDINKAIKYFTLAANQNHVMAQNFLGQIYHNGEYVQRNINKAINYFTLAANQNYDQAQRNLGQIYYLGIFIPRDIKKSIHYFTLAANNNDVISQMILANIYDEEKYVTRDFNKSIHYYTLAANQNNAIAQYNLAIFYNDGKDIERDINKAIHYYTLSANQNYAPSQFNLGVLYHKAKYNVPRDIKKALYYYNLAANQNHMLAQFNLGNLYDLGEFITQDIDKAIYYYSLSADQNCSLAQYRLGEIYHTGNFVPRDIKKAIHYFQLAGYQNHQYALHNLGVIYSDNVFIPCDIEKAIEYFTHASNLNFSFSQHNLGIIYSNLNDIEKSIYYYTLAANQNHSLAQYNLGIIYMNKKYTCFDINKAIYYFTLSANQNNKEAQNNLGYIYCEGNFIVRDINKAIYYFKLASDQNDFEAQNNLGNIFYDGIYIKRDINKAIYYYTLASKQNYCKSQYALGEIYYKGEYVKRDIFKAIHFLTLSSDQKFSEAQFLLGEIYFEGLYIDRDIVKAIHYFSLAANQNHSAAQLKLGIIYYNGFGIEKNVIKGIDFLNQSVNNGNKASCFILGFIYYEGKNVQRDIKKSIHYYKESSSFNIQYAKNNLGVIYKNGFDKEVLKNIHLAKEYFIEAIRQKSDALSMFNLALIYIYEENDLDKAIELLIKASNKNLFILNELLILALIKKCGLNYDKISLEINKFDYKNKDLFTALLDIIKKQKLDDPIIFANLFQVYKNYDMLYDKTLEPIQLRNLLIQKQNQINENTKNYCINHDIDDDFYDGFDVFL